jgi:proline iminopeptidase
MLTTTDLIEHWARNGRGPVATRLRRAATSALGTYGAYLGYGLLHRELRKPCAGPDAALPLPGDGLIAFPDSTKTFARDIWAPPEHVWPYLVQMGFGRAGWYGWYPMENGGRGSVSTILAEWQDLAVGDLIPDGPRADEGLGVWRVVELEPARTMVLYSRRALSTGRELDAGASDGSPSVECGWAFCLVPVVAGCRLVVRVSVKFDGVERSLAGRLLRRFFDVGDTVMEWTMLDGIKARAERRAAQRFIAGDEPRTR